MDCQPLESKMFLSTAYDAENRILYLRFRSGDVYRKHHMNTGVDRCLAR